MAIRFQRKHLTGERLAGNPQSVTRESPWVFSQRQMPGVLPGGGLT